MNEAEEQKKLLHDRGICVVIPTYNNGGTIGRVVSSVLQVAGDVIVVNDGSDDHTAEVLKEFADITLVTYPENHGKGYALKRGFQKALQMGFAYAITMDGDGQHDAADIASFLKASLEHPGALIVGSRNLDGVVRSKGSNFANSFSNFWFYVQTGRRLADTQSGFRLYPLRKLCGLSLLTSRYEAELELLVFASWYGVSLVSIPVFVYYPPQSERVSHFRPVADFVRISVLNTLLCLLAVVVGLPLRVYHFLTRWGRTFYALFFFILFSVFIITPCVWIYTKVGRMTEKKRYRLHQIIRWISRFVMMKHGIPGTTFSYQVADGVTFDKPYLVICNHQSHLDVMCQLVFTPKIVFLTNDWVWNNPFYGFLIRHAEYYPVAEGIETLLPQLQSLIARGYSIAVYPEGTRSRDCRILRFHQGAFYLADQLGVDILPMCLYGPGKVLPKRTYSLNKSPIHIQVMNPVSRHQLQAKGDYRQQASWMRSRYQEIYQDLANKIEQHV
ncbi:MAG: glycosyltransferase [Muribaculaceae bacterium]|nr:glycosyltransferase [Muribaculaceae bacterium]